MGRRNKWCIASLMIRPVGLTLELKPRFHLLYVGVELLSLAQMYGMGGMWRLLKKTDSTSMSPALNPTNWRFEAQRFTYCSIRKVITYRKREDCCRHVGAPKREWLDNCTENLQVLGSKPTHSLRICP